MTTYSFKGRDGKVYDVDAPEGTTEAAAFEQFNRYFAGSPAQAPKSPKADQAKLTKGGAEIAAGDLSWDSLDPSLNSIAVNLGSGVDSLVQGAKSLFGMASDGDVREKRIRDQALGDKTVGGYGGAVQLAGEIAPTLALPAGMAARAVGLGGRSLAPVYDAAITGGALGALQPVTSDESRLLNTGVGAIGGAILPGVAAGYRTVRDWLTRGGAESRAMQALIDKVGGEAEAQKVVDAIRTQHVHPATAGIPTTTAEATTNAALGAAERESAATNPAAWTDFRQAQRKARADALTNITKGADDLDNLVAARDAATTPLREKALAKAAQNPYAYEPVAQKIAQIENSAQSSNPAVASIVNYVKAELDKGPTPDRLYVIRDTLVNAVNGPKELGNTLSAAAKKADRQTMSIVQTIDDALEASSGMWKDSGATLNQQRNKYLNRYAAESKGVTDATASQRLRTAVEKGPKTIDPETGDSFPSITADNLRKNLNKFGSSRFGDTWKYGTRDALDALLANVEKSDLLQTAIKKAGTSGGGSNTAMDTALVQAGAESLKSATPIVGRALGVVEKRGEAFQRAAIQDALQNPQVFVRGVEKRLAANQPLTPSQAHVLNAIRAFPAATAVEAISP